MDGDRQDPRETVRLGQYNNLAVAQYQPLGDLIRRHRGRLTEVTVNGPGDVWLRVAGQGWIRPAPRDAAFATTEYFRALFRTFAAANGILFDEALPIVACRTPDGHRFQGMFGANVLTGFMASVRVMRVLDADFADFGVAPDVVDRLRRAMHDGRAVIVSGGTGSGKTTFLNLLNAQIPAWKRVVTIEDVPELTVDRVIPNCVRIVLSRTASRSQLTWQGAIDHVLRSAPDVFAVGELAIQSAYPTVQAMDTGHDSFTTTMHANSPLDALRGFYRRVQLSGHRTDARSFLEFMADTVDLIVQIRKVPGRDGKSERRQVTDVVAPKDILARRDREALAAGLAAAPDDARGLSPEERMHLAAARGGLTLVASPGEGEPSPPSTPAAEPRPALSGLVFHDADFDEGADGAPSEGEGVGG